jgi:hypothetical protein
LRRVAPAQTLPRGERGSRLATDLQPRPVPQSTPPKPKPASAGFVFPKTEYWDQLPSLSSESNAKTPRRAFCAGAFLMDFSRGIPCSAYTAKYPIPASGLNALRLSAPSDRNVRNASENIVKMEPAKIVTHYTTGRFSKSTFPHTATLREFTESARSTGPRRRLMSNTIAPTRRLPGESNAPCCIYGPKVVPSIRSIRKRAVHWAFGVNGRRS